VDVLLHQKEWYRGIARLFMLHKETVFFIIANLALKFNVVCSGFKFD